MCCEIMKKFCEIYGNEYFDGKYGVYDGEKFLFMSGCLLFKLMKFLVFLDNFEGFLCRFGDSGRLSLGMKCIVNWFMIFICCGICVECYLFVLLNCFLFVV